MEQSQTVYVPWSHWRLGGGFYLIFTFWAWHLLSGGTWVLLLSKVSGKLQIVKSLSNFDLFSLNTLLYISILSNDKTFIIKELSSTLRIKVACQTCQHWWETEITQVPGWQSKQERKDVIRSATAGSPALLCRHVIELKSFFTKLGSLHIDKQNHGHKWNNHKTLLLKTSIICSGWRMGDGRWGPRLWSDKSAHQREHYTNVSARGKHFRCSSAQTIWKRIAHFCQTTFISAILCE